MKFVLYGIGTGLIRRLRSFRGWLSLLLIPALVLGLNRVLPPEELTAPVQVGVCLPESGAEEFWELLRQRSGTVLSFVLATEPEMEGRVASGQWDCGLVLPEDFGEKIGKVKLNGLFTLYTGPGSVVYPLVRETVSACTAQLVSPNMAWEYLQESGLADGIEDTEAAWNRLNRVLDDSDRVLVTMTTPGGEPLEALALADSGIRQLLCWLVSCLVLIRMIMGAAELGNWMESPGVARMSPLRGKTSRMLIRMAPEALLTGICGSITLGILGFSFWSWVSIWVYVLFWLGAVILLVRIPALPGAMPVLMPFAAALSLLCSGILTNSASWMGWTPVGLFLAGCGGKMSALMVLSAASVLCLGAAFRMDQAKW